MCVNKIKFFFIFLLEKSINDNEEILTSVTSDLPHFSETAAQGTFSMLYSKFAQHILGNELGSVS